jgi:hypothetical protein
MDMLNKRIWLKGLAMECPLGKPLTDCPLNGIRCLPFQQISSTVNKLSDETVESIAQYHKHCYSTRLKAAKHPVL